MSLMLPLSMNSFIRLRLLTGLNELADTLDAHRDDVAICDRTDAGRRAGRNDVAWLERHDERDELDQVFDAEDQLGR